VVGWVGNGKSARRLVSKPPLTGSDSDAVAAAAWHAERPLKLVCVLRPNLGGAHGCRARALRWAASVCARRGLKGHECFVGQWSDALRNTFDRSYFWLLRRAQVFVFFCLLHNCFV